MMDIRKVNKLIELAKAQGVNLEIETKEGHIKITHPSAAMPPATYTLPQAVPPPGAGENNAAETSSNTQEHEGHSVKAPMVGTTYLASSPGSKPFVKVGDHVEVGDTLCLIEAMKMFNPIEADRAGTVAARLIDNQQPVEFDQTLFIITED
jgi:acetyl-CoA carboxylase biotin carboxyl carrier protein